MQLIEILSSLLGMVGAYLLASRNRYAGWAFVAWLISNVGWIAFGAGNQHWFFILQQIVFTVTSVIGIWHWLVRPTRNRPFVPTPEQRRRIRAAIEWALEADFVGLEQTPRVLHTTAPVTYDCLEHIICMGIEMGCELEVRAQNGGAA